MSEGYWTPEEWAAKHNVSLAVADVHLRTVRCADVAKYIKACSFCDVPADLPHLLEAVRLLRELLSEAEPLIATLRVNFMCARTELGLEHFPSTHEFVLRLCRAPITVFDDVGDDVDRLAADWRRIGPRLLQLDFFGVYGAALEAEVLLAGEVRTNSPPTMPTPESANVKACWRDAWHSYERAVNAENGPAPKPLKSVYRWLKAHDPDDDYELPPLATWATYLRRYRAAVEPTSGGSPARPDRSGRSIVKRKDT